MRPRMYNSHQIRKILRPSNEQYFWIGDVTSSIVYIKELWKRSLEAENYKFLYYLNRQRFVGYVRQPHHSL